MHLGQRANYTNSDCPRSLVVFLVVHLHKLYNARAIRCTSFCETCDREICGKVSECKFNFATIATSDEQQWLRATSMEQRADGCPPVLRRKTRVQSFEKLGATLGGESTSCRCYFRPGTKHCGKVGRAQTGEMRRAQQWIQNKPLSNAKTATHR